MPAANDLPVPELSVGRAVRILYNNACLKTLREGGCCIFLLGRQYTEVGWANRAGRPSGIDVPGGIHGLRIAGGFEYCLGGLTKEPPYLVVLYRSLDL